MIRLLELKVLVTIAALLALLVGLVGYQVRAQRAAEMAAQIEAQHAKDVEQLEAPKLDVGADVLMKRWIK